MSRPMRSFSFIGATSCSAEQTISQRDRLASRRHAELAAQRAIHPLELPKRGVAVAVGGVPSHEREMGDLVARVELDDGLPLTVESQEVEMVEAQLLATLLRPVLVPVVGQQLPAVHGERGARCGDVGVGERAPGEGLELHHVDRGLGLGAERDDVAAEHDRVRHVDGRRAKWAALCSLGAASSTVSSGQSRSSTCSRCSRRLGASASTFTERGRVSPSPVTVVDSDRVDGHTELSEHRHADRRHAP